MYKLNTCNIFFKIFHIIKKREPLSKCPPLLMIKSDSLDSDL